MKRNPLDEEIRKLTRLAESGDESAIKRLHAAQRRAGVPLNERWGYQALGDAVEEEHGDCDNNTCDITAALNAGYYLWAARLLEGATEAPKTEAALAAFGATEDELEEDRKGFVEGVHHLQCGCGAFVWGEDETSCGNCLDPLARDVERPDPIPGELPADLADKDILRHVDLDGYRLVTWDEGTYRGDRRQLNYRLYRGDETIFEGNDFGVSPMHADDSDEALRGLIGFLTLRPGDTDAEYFDGYTPRQRAFAEDEAEGLAIFALDDGPLPADVIGGEDPCEHCGGPGPLLGGLCASCSRMADDRRQDAECGAPAPGAPGLLCARPRGHEGGHWHGRQNPDEEMRQLERVAAGGDTQAAARLEWARMRIGERGERKYLVDLVQEVADEAHPESGEITRSFMGRMVAKKVFAVGVKAVLIAAGFNMKQISVTTPSHWTGGVLIAGKSLAPYNRSVRQSGTLPEKLEAQKKWREAMEEGYVSSVGGGKFKILDEATVDRLNWLLYAGVKQWHGSIELNVRDRSGPTDQQRADAARADVASWSEGPSLSSLWWDVFKAGVKRGLEGRRKNA